MQVDLTDKVTVLDGLRVTGAGKASHEAGMAALWTGTETDNGNNMPSGPSIDQAIAPLLQSQLGIHTPYPTDLAHGPELGGLHAARGRRRACSTTRAPTGSIRTPIRRWRRARSFPVRPRR